VWVVGCGPHTLSAHTASYLEGGEGDEKKDGREGTVRSGAI